MADILVAIDQAGLDLVIDDDLRAQLEALANVTWRSDLGGADTDTYAAAIRDANAGIVLTFWGSPLLTRGAMQANPQLKYLCHIAGTVRRIVERGTIEDGLIVTNWGNVISRICAEAALLMILSGLRCATAVTLDMHVAKTWPKEGRWMPRSLFERKVGLHGFGAIAQELAALLKPFGVMVSAYSPNAPDEAFERLGVTRATDLTALYAENDVVSIHTGKTDANYHIVTAEVLAAMPDGAVLVNTARGAIIDTDALVAELQTGRIHAAIDVYEDEPLPADSPLRGLPNCQLWPHWACPTRDRIIDCGRLAVQNVTRFLDGEDPVNRVTLARYDTAT